MVFIPGLSCPPAAGGSARTELPQSKLGAVGAQAGGRRYFLRNSATGRHGPPRRRIHNALADGVAAKKRLRFDQRSMAVSRPGDNQYRAVPGTRLFDRIQLRSCDTEAQGQLLNQQRREVGGIIA